MQRGFGSKLGYWLLSMSLALGLAACGGGGGSDSGTGSAVDSTSSTASSVDQSAGNASDSSSSSVPGGIYVGYYMEDPTTNPEDPMPGAFVLNLPSGDASFSGNMYFTYVGCQTSNVGTVSGTKSGTALAGTWTGTLDGSPESGPYNGSYDAGGFYHGVYSNSAGKQYKVVPGCIQYYIAPNGTWEMFPVESNMPSTFAVTVAVTVAGSTASWTAPAGAAYSLVYVIDPALLQAGANPVIWQGVVGGSTSSSSFGALGLTAGKEYIAVTMVFDSGYQRLAVGSKRFTAS